MDDDPGLRPEPWVSIELRDGVVRVDGEPVLGGSPEDRYLRAVRRVAEEVATPLARRVGVTVSDARGVVTHLAVSPDGTTESIEELVRAAAAAPAGPAGPAGPAQRDARDRLRVRPIAWVAVAALALAAVLAGAATLSAARDRPAATIAADPSTLAAPGREAPSPQVRTVVRTRWRSPGLALVADVRPGGPGVVTVLVGATRRPARVRLVIRPESGADLARTLVLHGGIRQVVVEGLAGGPAGWRIAAPGAAALTGTIRIRPVPAPAPVVPAYSSPTNSPGPSQQEGRARGHRSQGSAPAAPLVPIDPDDQ